jgi:hypothetical protein
MKINGMTDGIKVDGHRGTWYIIGKAYHKGQEVFLLEHEQYGDEAPAIIVNSSLRILAEDVGSGFGDLPGWKGK